MENCKLLYKNQVVPNNSTKLMTLFDPTSEVPQHLQLVYLNDMESLSKTIIHQT
jgi:hypothetical protein